MDDDVPPATVPAPLPKRLDKFKSKEASRKAAPASHRPSLGSAAPMAAFKFGAPASPSAGKFEFSKPEPPRFSQMTEDDTDGNITEDCNTPAPSQAKVKQASRTCDTSAFFKSATIAAKSVALKLSGPCISDEVIDLSQDSPVKIPIAAKASPLKASTLGWSSQSQDEDIASPAGKMAPKKLVKGGKENVFERFGFGAKSGTMDKKKMEDVFESKNKQKGTKRKGDKKEVNGSKLLGSLVKYSFLWKDGIGKGGGEGGGGESKKHRL